MSLEILVLIPWKITKAIGVLRNPLKNYKATQPEFNDGPLLAVNYVFFKKEYWYGPGKDYHILISFLLYCVSVLWSESISQQC